MSADLSEILVRDFLKNSWSCVETIVREVSKPSESRRPNVRVFHFENGQKRESEIEGGKFFLRGSVEYSNPQLTVEEVQGIIAVRLLAAAGNYFYRCGLHPVDEKDVAAMCELLHKPDEGPIVPFLLNTDEVEPDRYSMNPLKRSILDSGQSAFPSARVDASKLKIDEEFVKKYEGSLISRGEVDLITRCLQSCGSSYVDVSDAVKYEQLESLSKVFGMNLCLYSLRMPLAILAKESAGGLLRHVIREVHKDYQSIERAYGCMGRSMKKRTTLLTVPHSPKGYGSKRAARGKMYFDELKFKSVKVTYETTNLYPNAIDPNDVSVAQADDSFMIDGDKLANYSFDETPSSPQFFLYSLASPENAVLWHGIGAFGATQLLNSYANVRLECAKDSLIRDLKEKYGVSLKVPLQFNLIPQHMWFHPVHRNIDASIGCVQNLQDLASLGMRLEHLSAYERKT